MESVQKKLLRQLHQSLSPTPSTDNCLQPARLRHCHKSEHSLGPKCPQANAASFSARHLYHEESFKYVTVGNTVKTLWGMATWSYGSYSYTVSGEKTYIISNTSEVLP